jgi:hypothetical protein
MPSPVLWSSTKVGRGESKDLSNFFYGKIDALCSSLDISTNEAGHLKLQHDMEALDAFLAERFR